MKLAFLDLPDARADLIPLARRAEGVEIVLVVHPDPDALCLKLAHALGIPRSTEPLDLLALKPDRVALPGADTPSAAALARAGISERLFATLEELEADSWIQDLEGALERLQHPSQLLGELLESALVHLDADAGSILVLDDEAGELRTAVTRGISEESVGARFKVGEGIAGKAAASGTPVLSNGQPPRPVRRFTPLASAAHLAMPLLVANGRVLGVLSASRFRPDRSFGSPDVERAGAVAARISKLLVRTGERERLDADSAELRVRRSLEELFQGGSDAGEDRIRAAAGRLQAGLNARAVLLHVADPESRRLTVFSSDAPTGPDGVMPMGSGLIADVLSSGESVTLVSAGGSRRESAEGRPGIVPQLILAPIAPIGGSRPLGVIQVECPAAPTQDLEGRTRRVERLGGFLARLIETRRDGEAARRNALVAKLVDAAPRLLLAPDVHAVLAEGVRTMRHLLGARGLVSVRLSAGAQAGGDGMILSRTLPGDEPESAVLTSFDDELASLVLSHGIESTSIPGGAREGSRASDTEYLAVPIRWSGRTIGSLGAALQRPDRQAPRVICPPELEAVRKVAELLAVAWERVQSSPGAPLRVYDPLTGLLSGAGLEARILEEVKRAERYHDRMLLTLCSISAYDRLAQHHGLEWAEGLIREFARGLARNVREVDIVGRIEGGRFAVLSPQTERNGGALLRRLNQILPELEMVRALPDPDVIALVGRQYAFPEEVPTGGELLQLVQSSYTVR